MPDKMNNIVKINLSDSTYSINDVQELLSELNHVLEINKAKYRFKVAFHQMINNRKVTPAWDVFSIYTTDGDNDDGPVHQGRKYKSERGFGGLFTNTSYIRVIDLLNNVLKEEREDPIVYVETFEDDEESSESSEDTGDAD